MLSLSLSLPLSLSLHEYKYIQVQQDTSFEDIKEYVTVDLELDKPTWLKDVVKGDTNLGFEFESYFLELHLRNTGDTIATKDSAFPGLYYDITADIKQKDKLLGMM